MFMDLTVNNCVNNSNISLRGHLKNTPTLQKYLKELNTEDLVILKEALKVASKKNDYAVFELCEKKEKQNVLKPIPKIGIIVKLFLKELTENKTLSSEIVSVNNNQGKTFYYDKLKKVLLNTLVEYNSLEKNNIINLNLINKLLV